MPPTTEDAMGKYRIVQGKNRHAHKHIDVGHNSPCECAHCGSDEKSLGFHHVDVDAGTDHGPVVIVDAGEHEPVIGTHQSAYAEERYPYGDQGERTVRPIGLGNGSRPLMPSVPPRILVASMMRSNIRGNTRVTMEK